MPRIHHRIGLIVPSANTTRETEIPAMLRARDPRAPIDLSHKLNSAHCDAVVISACVQMPSLASVQPVENRRGLPVVSSSICTTWRMLKALNLHAGAPNAGSLLSGRY